MVHRAFVLSLILAAVVAPDALACSCVPPEVVYEDAKVAFIGTVVERTADRTAIDVERVFKGHVSGRVTYKGSGGGGVSSCDPEIEVGERIGVMAEPGGDLNLCNTTEASELERIAQPLPEPDGEGLTAFLVSGSFKENGVVALDAYGRILRYGRSIGFRAAACPGGRTVVGVDGSAIKVLRVRDLKVLQRLRGGAAYVRCLDAAGRRVVAAGNRGRLSIWTGARRRIVRVSRAQGPVALGQRRAVFATGAYRRARVMVIDYKTRRARRIHTTDRRYVYSLALSPDERRVLVASSAIGRGSELRVVPVGRGEHFSSTALGEFEDSVDVVWPARGRILLAVERKLLELDAATLEVKRRVSGWGSGVVLRGGAAYSITPSGELVTPDFAAGEARRVALLPRARVGPLVAVPPPVSRTARASASCRWRGMPRPFVA